jgi:DNA-binding XRE family transcriptional regulator
MYSKRQTEIWPSPRLIRAARGLVGIDQATLAEQAGLTRLTVLKIESDESDGMDPRRLKALQSLQRVFEDAYKIEFLAASKNSGEGLRFRKP